MDTARVDRLQVGSAWIARGRGGFVSTFRNLNPRSLNLSRFYGNVVNIKSPNKLLLLV